MDVSVGTTNVLTVLRYMYPGIPIIANGIVHRIALTILILPRV